MNLNISEYNISFDMVHQEGLKTIVDVKLIAKQVCNSFNDYFINYGIGLIVVYLAFTWLAWYYHKYGISFILRSNYINKMFEDQRFEFNRLYLIDYVRGKFCLAFMIYIIVVVWVSY